jgi:hypothetical protein
LSRLLAVGLLFLAGCSTTELQWQAEGTAAWQIAEEMVSLNPEGEGYLTTEGIYDDFELVIEFQPDNTVNSGILIRCQDRADITPFTCLEINIWDDHPNQDFRTGAIVIHAAPPLAQLGTVGEWNTYRIVANGPVVEAWLNGVLTARLNNTDLTDGFIALQSQNGLIAFRNARLIELNP